MGPCEKGAGETPDASIPRVAALDVLGRKHLSLIDPLQWFFIHEQPTPPTVVPLNPKRPFPVTGVASVTAVAFGRVGYGHGYARCAHGNDNPYPDYGPIDAVGRYCADVVAPDVKLDPAQQQRLPYSPSNGARWFLLCLGQPWSNGATLQQPGAGWLPSLGSEPCVQIWPRRGAVVGGVVAASAWTSAFGPRLAPEGPKGVAGLGLGCPGMRTLPACS